MDKSKKDQKIPPKTTLLTDKQKHQLEKLFWRKTTLPTSGFEKKEDKWSGVGKGFFGKEKVKKFEEEFMIKLGIKFPHVITYDEKTGELSDEIIDRNQDFNTMCIVNEYVASLFYERFLQQKTPPIALISDKIKPDEIYSTIVSKKEFRHQAKQIIHDYYQKNNEHITQNQLVAELRKIKWLEIIDQEKEEEKFLEDIWKILRDFGINDTYALLPQFNQKLDKVEDGETIKKTLKQINSYRQKDGEYISIMELIKKNYENVAEKKLSELAEKLQQLKKGKRELDEKLESLKDCREAAQLDLSEYKRKMREYRREAYEYKRNEKYYTKERYKIINQRDNNVEDKNLIKKTQKFISDNNLQKDIRISLTQLDKKLDENTLADFSVDTQEFTRRTKQIIQNYKLQNFEYISLGQFAHELRDKIKYKPKTLTLTPTLLATEKESPFAPYVFCIRSQLITPFQTIWDSQRERKKFALEINKVKSIEKVFASVIAMGEYDYNMENIGITVQDHERVLAKIDHGWSLTTFFTKPEIMLENFAAGYGSFGYQDVIPLNINKLKIAFDEILTITDNEIENFIGSKTYELEKKSGLTIENLKFSFYEDDKTHSFSPKRLEKKFFKTSDEYKKFIIEKFKKQIKVMKEARRILDIISKINYDDNETTQKKWQNGTWLQDIKGGDPIGWAANNGKKIEGEDPIIWAIKNKKQIEKKAPALWAQEAGYKIVDGKYIKERVTTKKENITTKLE